MPDNILIVDDEVEIADLIALYLENEDFTVFKYYNAADALKYIRTGHVDLAILDVMLPDMSGFQLCKKIREKYQYPVIMLTAKGEEVDKITGLTLGADDYITKPFQPLEVVARVKAQLRRYKRYNLGTVLEENVIVHAGLIMNIKTHACFLNEKTPFAHTHRILDFVDPVPEQGECCELRRAVSSDLGRRVFQQKQ